MPQHEIYIGEGWVKPHHCIVLNCGDHALKQLELVIDRLIAMGCTFKTAHDYALEYGAL